MTVTFWILVLFANIAVYFLFPIASRATASPPVFRLIIFSLAWTAVPQFGLLSLLKLIGLVEWHGWIAKLDIATADEVSVFWLIPNSLALFGLLTSLTELLAGERK